MFKNTPAFSSFSVDDLDVAKRFYEDTLGIKAENGPMGITLNLTGTDGVFVYAKPDHVPATFTVLNFAVKDVEETVDELTSKGIVFEQYEGRTDAKGVAHPESAEQGPEIAWFKDPAGNILSVLQRL
jgi:predicted enzyme related to lactoylglutathione lyase